MITATDAELRLRDLLREIVVLRQPEKANDRL
jgi:hypothetical protein